MTDDFRVRGDDQYVVDRLAATHLDHHVEEQLLGKTRAIAVGNHAAEALVGTAELLDGKDGKRAKSFCSEHSSERLAMGILRPGRSRPDSGVILGPVARLQRARKLEQRARQILALSGRIEQGLAAIEGRIIQIVRRVV